MAARKKTVSKKVSKAPSKQINVRADLRVSEDTPYYYVNSVEITMSSNEFTLIGAKAPTKLPPEYQTEALKTGRLSIDANVQLILPINTVPAIIKALETQKDTYEKLFGKIYDATAE